MGFYLFDKKHHLEKDFGDPKTRRTYVKVFDYQVWLPVAFKLDGNISKLVWLDEWEI